MFDRDNKDAFKSFLEGSFIGNDMEHKATVAQMMLRAQLIDLEPANLCPELLELDVEEEEDYD